MEEEKEIQDEQLPPITSTPLAEESTQTDSSALISAANLAADRLEKGNKELAKLLAIQQQLHIEKKLGGETVAGVPGKSDEEKAIENAKKMLEGTGMEEYAFPKN